MSNETGAPEPCLNLRSKDMFYKHVTDTMRRIPFGPGGASCADNLVLAKNQ